MRAASRISVSARFGLIAGGIPLAPPPAPPRFLVGALVKSITGRRGEVVEVYQDERRVLASDGTREWFHADQLVAATTTKRRTRRRRTA